MTHTRTDVLIVGTGFSGLGMAIQLTRSGRTDYLLVEKADDVGGTWRDNVYPGCACDIPSHMYSFSYQQNPAWSRSFSPQPEIWDYLRDVADRYDLRARTRFGTELVSAGWEESEQRWESTAANGDTFSSRLLVAGIGALHIPRLPDLPGMDSFAGPMFHSAAWDQSTDLTGKRVAVVGTGASAIQFVPQIAPDVEQLHVFQRTAPWLLPRPDHPISVRTQQVFAKVPGAQRAYRNLLYWILESRALGFNGHPGFQRLAERLATKHLERKVEDPELRAKLRPDYRLGCKRVLLSSDYYPALARDNVELVDRGVAEVREHSVVDADGVEREVDAIIFGTGFHVVDAFQYLDIEGVDGISLAKQFDEKGVETYLGINVHGFPNLIFLLGPNTGLGHNSVVFMIEQQAAYAIRLLDEMDRRSVASVDVRSTAQREFNDSLQRRLARGIWTQGGCTSWYLDVQGVNRAIWPGFTWKYWLETRRIDTRAYTWGEPAVREIPSEVGVPA
ncbi:MAG: flavin-containing monooxygenase [Nocardioidaceae bacterium]